MTRPAEVVRARHRVIAAMRMQTVEQGRYLGGRPPYGILAPNLTKITALAAARTT